MNASVISLASRVERLDRLAWLPLPILVLAMLVLWAMNLQGAYFAPRLVFVLQLVFMTFASALIIYLVSRSLSPAADDCVRRITTAAGRMDRLIQDSFNYGRLMREDLPLSPIDPASLLGGMIETYPSFQPPHADVLLEAPFPRVVANEAGLTQCMSNLLGNAVKFVAPGVAPRVRVWAESVDGRVRLLVRDNGIGMDKDAHRTLFRIFHRLGTGYEGTGVGLAIVKKAAERMGGRVGFESELGQGSTFWVDLAPADDAGGGA